jgi:hypothetical protein
MFFDDNYLVIGKACIDVYFKAIVIVVRSEIQEISVVALNIQLLLLSNYQ